MSRSFVYPEPNSFLLKPSLREKTVAERLEPTLLNAIAEKTKYASKARLTGYALNIAIGLQVLLGSLTTALSVVTKGSQVNFTLCICIRSKYRSDFRQL